jgi:hypothetical protein
MIMIMIVIIIYSEIRARGGIVDLRPPRGGSLSWTFGPSRGGVRDLHVDLRWTFGPPRGGPCGPLLDLRATAWGSPPLC